MKERKPFKQLRIWQKSLIIGGISLGGVILLAVGVVGSYLAYVSAQFFRVEDNKDLTADVVRAKTETKKATSITSQDELSILTYNIGFGAYDQEFDFFMDEGYMLDGTHVQGRYSRARSYEACLRNTKGAIEDTVKEDVDFALIQEVDTDSDRSHHINQYQMYMDAMPSYDAVFAYNFHTANLLYPFNDPIGVSNSGLATLSKYELGTVTRRSYPVDLSFPNKFFDLDRCFNVSRQTLSNGKELVIANSHMSAYDEGGVYRRKQIELLNQFMSGEKEKGNYVIIGGDFNHDIIDSVDKFPSQQKKPEWVYTLTNDDLTEGFSFAASLNAPTCRAAEMPYTKGVNYTVVIDGFIVSDNIDVKDIHNIDLDFMWSDHNPAKMTFSLKMGE